RRSTQTAVAFHSGYVRTGGLRFSASAYRRLTTLALRRMTMPRWDLALRQQASLPHISTQGDAAINENARHVAGRCRLLWTFASYGFSWRGFNTAKQANPKLARGFVLQGCEAVEGPVVGASPAAFEILRALLSDRLGPIAVTGGLVGRAVAGLADDQAFADAYRSAAQTVLAEIGG